MYITYHKDINKHDDAVSMPVEIFNSEIIEAIRQITIKPNVYIRRNSFFLFIYINGDRIDVDLNS